MNFQHIQSDIKQKQPRKQFTFEEDKMLKKAVSDVGDNDWEKVAMLLPNRTPRQCRDRWNKYLSPNIRGSMWTDEEDQLLLSLIQKYGNKWSKISTFIKGRSDINIKNRYKQLVSQGSHAYLMAPPISSNFNKTQNIQNVQNFPPNNINNNTNLQTRIEKQAPPPDTEIQRPKPFLNTITLDPIIAENAAIYNTKAIAQLRELFESLGPIEPIPCSRPSLKM